MKSFTNLDLEKVAPVGVIGSHDAGRLSLLLIPLWRLDNDGLGPSDRRLQVDDFDAKEHAEEAVDSCALDVVRLGAEDWLEGAGLGGWR